MGQKRKKCILIKKGVVLFLILFFILISTTNSVLAKSSEFSHQPFENYAHSSEIDKTHTDGTWGQSSNGLIAKIWSEKEEFIVGEPIVVHYIVKNIADKDIMTWHSGFWPNHLLVVMLPDGKKVTSQDLGLRFDPGGIREKNVPWPIRPGNMDDAQPSYDISRIFDMSSSGGYSVQYLYEEYQGDWEGKLYSNILHIRVKEKQ